MGTPGSTEQNKELQVTGEQQTLKTFFHVSTDVKTQDVAAGFCKREFRLQLTMVLCKTGKVLRIQPGTCSWQIFMMFVFGDDLNTVGL